MGSYGNYPNLSLSNFIYFFIFLGLNDFKINNIRCLNHNNLSFNRRLHIFNEITGNIQEISDQKWFCSFTTFRETWEMDEEKYQRLRPYKLNPNQVSSINTCVFVRGIVDILKVFHLDYRHRWRSVDLDYKICPLMSEIIKEHGGWNTL